MMHRFFQYAVLIVFVYLNCIGTGKGDYMEPSTATIPRLESTLNYTLPKVAQYDLYANYSGDVLLAAFFPMHTHNVFDTNQPCATLNTIDGPHILEAMVFALDQINKQPNFLKFKLGAVALDTCGDPDRALSQAVDILFRTNSGEKMVCSDGQPPLSKNSAFDHSKIVGVVGALRTDVTMSLANVLRVFKVPQISYYSTTDKLSSKSKYPYFFRTVPSDLEALKAIVELLKVFEWSWVNIIYDPSTFSINARDKLEELINFLQSPICIRQKIRVDESMPYTFNTAIQYLKNEPKTDNDTPQLTTVIILLPHHITLKLFDAIRKDNSNMSRSYNWIGMNGWAGRYLKEEENAEILPNLISVEPTMYLLPGFKEYLQGQRPSLTKRNPWLKEFFEQQCQCSYTENSNETVSCLDVEEDCGSIVFKNFNPIIYDQFVVNAVYAFAHSLAKLQNIMCMDKPDCKIGASNFTGPHLRDTLRRITFDDLAGEKFKFDASIDGPIRYSIMYYTNNSWVEGGTYKTLKDSFSKRFILTEEFMSRKGTVYPESKCYRKCQPDEATISSSIACCWTCMKCGPYEMIKTSTKSKHILFQETECAMCAEGTKPIANRTNCTDIEVQSMNPNEPIAIIIIITSLIGVVITIITTGIFIFYNATPIIKASGRESSSILLFGILLSYIAPILMVMEPTEFICSVTYVSPGMCATICYAAILAKTNRIARIFQTTQHTKKKKIKFTSPLSQVYIIATMILAEMVILVILIVMEKPTLNSKKTNTSNQLLCSTMTGQNILVTGMMFPVILLILSTMYAFKIRKTPDGFNETRSLCFLNYANTALYIICLPLVYVFKDNIYWSLPMCCLLCCSATSQLFGIFVTKLYIVLLRPEKNTNEAVMNRTRSQSQLNGMTGTLTNRQFSTVSKMNELSEVSVNHHPSLDSGVSVVSATSSDCIELENFSNPTSNRESRQTTFIIAEESDDENMHSWVAPPMSQKSVSFDASVVYVQTPQYQTKTKSLKTNQVSPQSPVKFSKTLN